jgi:hypothetical protein
MSMKINFVVAGAMTALLAMSASAPPAVAQQVSSRDPNAVTAGTYKVEPYHTQVTFSISHFGFTEFSGFFSGAAGTLQIDPATAAAARLEVSIPVSSILTTTPALDDMLKSDQWFDAAKVSERQVRFDEGHAHSAGQCDHHRQVHASRRHQAGHSEGPARRFGHQPDGQDVQRRLRGGREDQAQRFRHQAVFAAGGRRGHPEDCRRLRSSAVTPCGRTIPPAGTPGSPSPFIG